MKTSTKRKIGAVILKIVAVASSVGAPVAAVLKEFPIFRKVGAKELSVGGVMVLLIVLFGFRREIWPLLRDKLHINSAGSFIFWGVFFVSLLWMEKIADMLPAMRSICLFGLAGTGIGQVANTTAEFVYPKNKEVAKDDED